MNDNEEICEPLKILKNSFLELTKNDEDATHTRLLYYDLKMMSL